jgi:hypothetical protein
MPFAIDAIGKVFPNAFAASADFFNAAILAAPFGRGAKMSITPLIAVSILEASSPSSLYSAIPLFPCHISPKNPFLESCCI